MSTPVTLFIANNGGGPELWRTDGTSAGTFALSGAGVATGSLALVDGQAFFETADGQGSFGPLWEIWRTDGTAAGTVEIGLTTAYQETGTGSVAVMNNGTTLYLGTDNNQHQEALFANSGSGPQLISNLGVTQNEGFRASFLGAVGGEEFIGAPGNTFWETDGTAAGTHLVNTGSLSLSGPSQFVELNSNEAFFTAGVGGATELIETDGTNFTAITNPAIVGAGGFSNLMAVGGRLFFTTGSGGLISWDGSSSSAVTVAASSAQFPTVLGGDLYFIAPDENGPSFGSALWTTDGTVAGTHEVATGSVSMTAFGRAGSRYVMEDSAHGQNGLFVSDGTGASTTLVMANVTPVNFVDAGSQVFFTMGTDLWVSNGTVAGTHLVEHFTSIAASMTAVGNDLLFSASTDPISQGLEPWVSNGTAAGTHELVQIHPSVAGDLVVTDAVSFGGGIAFVGQVQGGATELWTSDGTAAGTAALPPPTYADSSVFGPVPFAAGGVVYFVGGNFDGVWAATSASAAPTPLQLGDQFFTAFNGELFAYGGDNLFFSNGTVAGTTSIGGYTLLSQPAVLGSELVFIGSTNADGTGVYATDGTAGGTSFIAAVPSAATPSGLTVSGSQAFFVAGSAATGAELWVTDGTAGGTHLVEDIAPGVGGSSPTNITPFDGGVVFDATDLTHGNQLWFSNGTAGGTFQLDINQTHNPAQSLIMDQLSAFSFGGKVWFLGNDGIHGEQLFSTDGTTAGTAAIATLDPNAAQATSQFPEGQLPTAFTAVGSGEFVFADASNLWVSDGTSGGTSELSAGFQGPTDLASVDGLAFFVASPTGVGANDLWVTDGTAAGTTDIGRLSSSFANFATAGDDVFYFSSDSEGSGLFAYNAISRSSTLLGAIPGNAAVFTDVGGQLTLGSPNNTAASQVWITDGTAAGTHELAQTSPVFFTDFTMLAGKGYFLDFSSGTTLWVTDGTPGGTEQLLSANIQNQTLTPIGDELYFEVAQNNVTSVWAYNPATETAAPVADGNVNSIPTDFIAAGTGGYFIADDQSSRGELWHIDASGNFTELTSASNGDVDSASAPSFTLAASGSNLFFTADDTTHGQSLFFTNGSSVTFLAQVAATNFTVIGGELYFQGEDGTNGAELWVSNGTAAGTHRVTDTEAPGNAAASGFVTVGADMFFAANDGVHGSELWMFNGQPGGATMVADIDPGATGSNPANLTAFDGAAYFVASNGTGPAELWRSDGTAGGTTAVTTASNGAAPQDLTVDGAELFFFASDSAHGSGLFVSNGVAGGTSFLGSFSAIGDMTVSGGDLYFDGTDSAGTELWTSNGTAVGTVKLSDTGTDPGSNPTGFISLGTSPETAFTARDDFNGDGVSDVLIENSAGAIVVGEAENGQETFTTIGALGPEWSFKGVGDFLGDGHEGFLIENSAGAVDVGEVVNGQTSYTAVAGLGQEWSFHGAGDFLGDGQDQFLIENTSGAVVVAEVQNGQAHYTTVAGLGSEWTFQGAGDFLGDGKDDFLIQNSAGAVAFGEVTNGSAAFTTVTALGPEWKFVGTGDFLGEGHDQFLIENAAGAVDIADWTGGAIHFTQVTALGPEWKFVGAGDYLGEGHDQFLIENAAGAVDVADWTGGAIHFTQVTALGPEWVFH